MAEPWSFPSALGLLPLIPSVPGLMPSIPSAPGLMPSIPSVPRMMPLFQMEGENSFLQYQESGSMPPIPSAPGLMPSIPSVPRMMPLFQMKGENSFLQYQESGSMPPIPSAPGLMPSIPSVPRMMPLFQMKGENSFLQYQESGSMPPIPSAPGLMPSIPRMMPLFQIKGDNPFLQYQESGLMPSIPSVPELMPSIPSVPGLMPSIPSIPRMMPLFQMKGENSFLQYPEYNLENSALELGYRVWPNINDQHYLRGCKWSPDGTFLLTTIRGAGMNIVKLPSDLFVGDKLMSTRTVESLYPAVKVPESGLIYDYCWYPRMESGNSSTCCWIASGRKSPIHLWDAFSGKKRCSYRGYNGRKEVEAASSLTFSADGKQIFGGYRKSVRIFHTSRPGHYFTEYRIKNTASCLAASEAQPNVLAIGYLRNSIELVSQNNRFRRLCKLVGHKGGVTHLVFSFDGRRLYSGAKKDNRLLCWDLRVPGKPLYRLQRHSSTNQRIYLDISKNGNWLVSGGTNGKAQIWNISTATQPTLHMELPVHRDCCNGVSLHPYRPILATSSGHHQTTVYPKRNLAATTENKIAMWWLGHCCYYGL